MVGQALSSISRATGRMPGEADGQQVRQGEQKESQPPDQAPGKWRCGGIWGTAAKEQEGGFHAWESPPCEKEIFKKPRAQCIAKWELTAGGILPPGFSAGIS